MVPAHGRPAGERTTARAGGTRTVHQVRHMEIIGKPKGNVVFSVGTTGASVPHKNGLCSEGQHVCLSGGVQNHQGFHANTDQKACDMWFSGLSLKSVTHGARILAPAGPEHPGRKGKRSGGGGRAVKT